MSDIDNTEILDELYHEEAELKKDEKLAKRTILVFAILILAIIGVVSLLSYKFFTYKPTATVYNKIVQTIPASAVSPTSEITSPTPVTTKTTGGQTQTQKDYYINIGYGTNQSGDWSDVAGAIITADITQYSNIKSVYFEPSVNVPSANGNVSIRLYNVTDKHPVWNSEITRTAVADTNLFISPLLSYDTGPKLYQVQMKTEMNVTANLIQSRIHVVTK